MALALAVPVLLAWVPLLMKDRRPVWFLAPTLAALAFGLWAEPFEQLFAGATGIVAARALSRVVLLVVLPLVLLWLFGEGNLVPGAPALGLGRDGVRDSLVLGLAASVVLVPLAWWALAEAAAAAGGAAGGTGAIGVAAGDLPFLAVEAVAEEVFFRGILLLPLVPVLGRTGAFLVAVPSFLLSRPHFFVAAGPSGLALLAQPLFALSLTATGVLLAVVALRSRSAAGPGLARSLVRLVPLGFL